MKKKTKKEMEEEVILEEEKEAEDVEDKASKEENSPEEDKKTSTSKDDELDLGLDKEEDDSTDDKSEDEDDSEEEPTPTTINKTEYLTEVKPEFKEVAEMFFSLDSIEDPEELKVKITETQNSFEEYLQKQFVPKIVKSLEMKQQGAVKQGVSGQPQEPERKRITTPRRNLR